MKKIPNLVKRSVLPSGICIINIYYKRKNMMGAKTNGKGKNRIQDKRITRNA